MKYSNCCYAEMPNYDFSDICPKCGEHSIPIDEEPDVATPDSRRCPYWPGQFRDGLD